MIRQSRDLGPDEKREFSPSDNRTAGYLMGAQYAPLVVTLDRVKCEPFLEAREAPDGTWRGVNNGRGD